MDSNDTRGRTDVEGALTFLQLAFAGGMITLVVLIASRELATGEAWTIVGLAALAVAAALCRTGSARKLLERVAKLSIGPFGVDLLQKVGVVAEKSPPEELGDQTGASSDVVDLRLKLERKLTYIATSMLADGGHPSYVTIGSLAYDGYLTEDQARTASELMTLRPGDLMALSSEEKEKFLDDADRLVGGLRASVFRVLVKNELRSMGWAVTEMPRQARQARPDYEARKGEIAVRIAPVFATNSNSRLIDSARARLGSLDADGETAAPVIVLPNNSERVSEGAGNPSVIKQRDLKAQLEQPRRRTNAGDGGF